MLKLFIIIIAIFTCCLTGIFGRSNSIPKEFEPFKDYKRLDYDLDGAINKLSRAITYETVSTSSGYVNETEILRFIDFLEKSFPKVHNTPWIERQIINKSLVYVVKSQSNDVTTSNVNHNDAATDEPWILSAHQDVVPATDCDQWTAPPFSGEIIYRPDENITNPPIRVEFVPGEPVNHDYFVYGRGTMDSKHIIMSILEALEHMISIGHRLTTNSLVLSFGQDEETGGIYGAKAIARYLKERFNDSDGKPFTFLLDEGFNIMTDVLPQNAKLGAIGVGEKVTADVTLTVESTPGHSSIPPKENAISILAGAVDRLQAFDFPSMFAAPGTPDLEFCRRIAPVYPENRRILLLNADLFVKEIPLILDKNVYASSLHRTSNAVTLINGGVKSNVVPSWAQANFNHRIHPLQTPSEILNIDTAVVNDSRVVLEIKTDIEFIPITNYDSNEFYLLEEVIQHLFGNASTNQTIVVPAIVTGGTDSKHFIEIVRNIYRFSPLTIGPSDFSRPHGINERISVAVYDDCINFYYRLIERVSGLSNV